MDVYRAQVIIEIFNLVSLLKRDALSNIKANQIIYAIEKLHLQRYGCAVLNDDYKYYNGFIPINADRIYNRNLNQFPLIITEKFDQTLIVTPKGLRSDSNLDFNLMGKRIYQMTKNIYNEIGDLNDEELIKWSQQFVPSNLNPNTLIDKNTFFEIKPDFKNVFLTDKQHIKLSKKFYNGKF